MKKKTKENLLFVASLLALPLLLVWLSAQFAVGWVMYWFGDRQEVEKNGNAVHE